MKRFYRVKLNKKGKNCFWILHVGSQAFGFHHIFITLGTRGFSRVRREFSVFGRRPTHLRAGHYKDLTETGNRARNVSGTQGTFSSAMKWTTANSINSSHANDMLRDIHTVRDLQSGTK